MAVAARYETETHIVANPDLAGWRVSWGGIWGGFLAVMGTLLLLSALGLAIGISAVDVGSRENPDAGTIGTSTAIWTGVSLLIALFVGGMVATRISMIFDRTTAALEGMLVWVLTILATLWFATSSVGFLVGGVSNMLGGAARTVAAAAGTATDLGALSQGNVEQIIARLNDPQTVRTIAAATGVPEAEVRQVITNTRQRVEAVRENPAQVAAEVRTGIDALATRVGNRLERTAARVQPEAATAAWMTFAALVLSLLAAVIGATAGQRRAVNRVAGT
ncbi:MAG: hypothetical protein ACRECQ_02100 [Burkholderiaceae bacterium]